MRQNSKRNIYFIAIFVVAMIIGVGYAYLSSNLNITGNTTINKNTWDIHFENLAVTSGSITATTPAAIDANRTTVNLSFSLNYAQADDNVVGINSQICKRATTLHTETCSQTESTGCSATEYATGDTITYGNLGTEGTLTSGDAFDCDVNGDGTYDSNTERFYYVSDLDIDSDYVVLIYYNNVSGGVSNNTALYAYDPNYKPRENGPVTAIKQLPTISQWSNVSLSNTTRIIKEETGTEYISFSYEGYISRLLTHQEVVTSCGVGTSTTTTGYLDNCKYLMENTRYSNDSLKAGYWLESPHSSYMSHVWYVFGGNRSGGATFADSVDNFGVRPAIEIPKVSISY